MVMNRIGRTKTAWGENIMIKEAIEKMKKNVFKTKTGIELLNHIFEL